MPILSIFADTPATTRVTPASAIADPAPDSPKTAESTSAEKSLVADATAVRPLPADESVAASAATSMDAESVLELPIEEVFFKSSELDEQPYPLQPIEPVFPYEARVNEREGWVRLLLLIDHTGQLRHIEVLDASSPGAFDEAAIMAFRATPFAPGRRAGEAVNSRMIVKVEFKQEQLSPPFIE